MTLKSLPIWYLSKTKQCLEDDLVYKTSEDATLEEEVTCIQAEIRRSFQTEGLEVSQYSNETIGRELTYSQLYVDGSPLWSVFRAGFIGSKSGPHVEYCDLPVEVTEPMIYTYDEKLIRYWYYDGEKSYSFGPSDTLAFLDFLYLRAVMQNSDISRNLSVILRTYKYVTDITYEDGTLFTPAKSVCFLKYLFDSSYGTMLEELMHNADLFSRVHSMCFGREVPTLSTNV